MSFITCSKGHQNSVGANFCIHCGEILNNVGNAKTQVPSITCPRTYLVPSILVTLFAFLPGEVMQKFVMHECITYLARET